MKEALLVLDAQRVYTDEESELYCEGASQTIDNINSLIQFMVKQEKMIVLVRHIHKIDGSDLGRLFDFGGEAEEDFNFKEGSEEIEYDERLIIPANSLKIKKTRYSAFAGTNLENILNENNIERVIICGFMTNFCCESTAREALDRDYYVDFIMDATGTPGTDKYDQNQIRKIVSELLSAGFARILPTMEKISNSEKN